MAFSSEAFPTTFAVARFASRFVLVPMVVTQVDAVFGILYQCGKTSKP